MGRSDDSISRRRSKRSRRKQEENSSNKVSQRVASIIAAKKRRATGKRSRCQGMCFSLPTIEDPFNQNRGKATQNNLNKITKKPKPKPKLIIMNDKKEEMTLYCPSKFLIACLNRIQKQAAPEDKPFFVHPWGIDFWKAYSHGQQHLIQTTTQAQAQATLQEIAWIAATCTDTIATMEKQGHSFSGPFLIFLVPTQHRASQVRQICKSLKDCGIRTVSLHSAASIDHQIHGLKSCEPEFVVSTPERLLELVSLNAIDITGISMLVIEKPGAVSEGGYNNAIESIKDLVPASSHKVVFSDSQ